MKATRSQLNAPRTLALILISTILARRDVEAFFEPRKACGARAYPLITPTALAEPPAKRASRFLPLHSSTWSCVLKGSAEQGSATHSSYLSSQCVPVPLWRQFLFNMLQPVSTHRLRIQSLPSANLASFPFWSKLSSSLHRRGAGFFLALLFVALLQGGLAVFQYRTNPSGELRIPPGLTVGVEMPQNATLTVEFPMANDLPLSSPAAAARLRSGGQIRNVSDTSSSLSTGPPQLGMMEAWSNVKGSPSLYSRILQHVNRFLWILAPWLGGSVSLMLKHNSHLLHIGSILTLARIFDFPQGLWLKRQQAKSSSNNSSSLPLSLGQGEREHVVVIGDSLAVGLGSVNQYDTNKTNDWPFQRIENLPKHDSDSNNKPGPAFPKTLAQTLAKKLQKCVTWRSAGVDGGDVHNIRKFCLSIIDEEVREGRVPDVVVILCGANDMKYCLSNPLQKEKRPRAFRSKLTRLIREIRSKAPHSTIIVPAIPTQMFHKNSPLNVFPLGQLLDVMGGFWDSQKKFVVDSFDSKGVQYIGLSPMEINRWYNPNYGVFNDGGVDHFENDIMAGSHPSAGITLLAIDGVHPNARCYTNWGASIGKKLLAKSGWKCGESMCSCCQHTDSFMGAAAKTMSPSSSRSKTTSSQIKIQKIAPEQA